MEQHKVGDAIFARDVAKLPNWDVEELPDGSLSVAQTQDARMHRWPARAAGAVAYNVFIQAFIAGMLGFIPRVSPVEGDFATAQTLLFAVPFFCVGVVIAHQSIWSLMGHDEWIASRHSMEHQRGWKHSEQRKSRLYADAQAELYFSYHKPDSDTTEHWSLQLSCSYKQANKHATIGSTEDARFSPEELRALGKVLSEATGWPLVLREKSAV